MKEGYIEYKGEQIPNTEETILEHNKNAIGKPIILPNLHFKAEMAPVPFTTKVSYEDFVTAKDKSDLIDQYVNFAKLCIDSYIDMKTSAVENSNPK